MQFHLSYVITLLQFCTITATSCLRKEKSRTFYSPRISTTLSCSRAGFAIASLLALPALPDSPCVANVSLPNTATDRSFTMAEHDVPPRTQLVRTAELIPRPFVCQEKKLGKLYNVDYILCKSVLDSSTKK